MGDGLTLEKMKVVERLNSLETKVDVLIGKLEVSNKDRDENIKLLSHIIVGNGEKGVAERVRNLEESENKRKKFSNAAWLAIISLACKSAWDSLTGK